MNYVANSRPPGIDILQQKIDAYVYMYIYANTECYAKHYFFRLTCLTCCCLYGRDETFSQSVSSSRDHYTIAGKRLKYEDTSTRNGFKICSRPYIVID